MKVFLSWSEHRSRLAAEAFKTWIEGVLQCVEPWMSPDLEKGANWPSELIGRLETTCIGIVFLTSENLTSTWLHFEVGAIARTRGGRPCIVLLDISTTDVKGPLSLYQLTRCTEDDIRRLVQDLRASAESGGEKVISASALDTLFNRLWPAFEQSLRDIRKSGTTAGPVRTLDDLSRETLSVVRSLRDEIAALRTEMSGAGIVPPRTVAPLPIEGVFRIRQDVPPERIDEMLTVSTTSFPNLTFNRQNEILLVTATNRFEAQEEWAAWRKAYGSLVFAPK